MEDLENISKSLAKCRQIKQEILRFGISQLEILKLIKLLSLELEDREKMLEIAEIVDEKKSSIILQEE